MDDSKIIDLFYARSEQAIMELSTKYGAVCSKVDKLTAKELSDALDQFLDTLDQENRVIFVRRYWYSDSISEIAERLHMSKNNVSVRLSRTRERLKNYLKKEGYIL